MKLTVGIPTWNREDSLYRTLNSLTELNVPRSVSLEVIVVDNNSTDGTSQVMEAFAPRLPLLRLFETNQGRAWALNAAVEVATGEYIVWTDDDVLFDEDWIATFYKAFVQYPDVGVWGGSIDPFFLGGTPDWIANAMPEVGGVFGLCCPQAGPLHMDDSPLPFGANMAIRMDVQRRFPFDTLLGRRGRAMLAGEESAMVRSALASGVTGRWLPEAKVRHVIPLSMQTRRHVRRYFRGLGATMALASGASASARPGGWGEAWLWRQAIESEVRYWLGRAVGRPAVEWARHLRLASTAQGYLKAARGR